jgi:hypothetical protein
MTTAIVMAKRPVTRLLSDDWGEPGTIRAGMRKWLKSQKDCGPTETSGGESATLRMTKLPTFR